MGGLQIERHQYGVGHGGFHVGLITRLSRTRVPELFSYIYDVGARPSVAALRDGVDRAVELLDDRGVTAVDRVILSHLDVDHVNGLDYLLSTLRGRNMSVRTLGMPWLNVYRQLQLINRYSPNTFIGKFSRNPIGALSEYDVENIGFADAADGGDGDIASGVGDGGAGVGPAPGAGSGALVASTVLSQVPLDAAPFRSRDWVLRFHAPTVSRSAYAYFLRQLLTKVNQASVANLDLEDIAINYRREYKAAMLDAANRFNEPWFDTLLNSSSISMYSGPSSGSAALAAPSTLMARNVRLFSALGRRRGVVLDDVAPGWIHTGDSPLSVPQIYRQFENAFASHFDAVGVVNLPHHGSEVSYQRQMSVALSASLALSSNGTYASGLRAHRLPATRVIADAANVHVPGVAILRQGGCVYHVTSVA